MEIELFLQNSSQSWDDTTITNFHRCKTHSDVSQRYDKNYATLHAEVDDTADRSGIQLDIRSKKYKSHDLTAGDTLTSYKNYDKIKKSRHRCDRTHTVREYSGNGRRREHSTVGRQRYHNDDRLVDDRQHCDSSVRPQHRQHKYGLQSCHRDQHNGHSYQSNCSRSDGERCHHKQHRNSLQNNTRRHKHFSYR